MSAMPQGPGNTAEIAACIATQGYCVHPQFIGRTALAALRAECIALHAAGGFRPAGVGKSAQRHAATRADQIAWLEPGRSGPAATAAMQDFEELRLALNRMLYLGLFEFECHFAHYPRGARYSRHLDQMHGDSSRMLSCALYLNDAWSSDEGGALRIYLEATGRALDVLPVGGTLVCFLSGQFEHEVLSAARDRWSFTGWFRTR